MTLVRSYAGELQDIYLMYKTFVFNRVDDSKVKLKMAKTKYTLEEPKNVAERIKKGTDTKS